MKKILTSTNYELIHLNDKTNVRFYTSIDSGSYVSPHWHDAIEIIYMQKGELKIILDNETHNLKPNQCIMISPNRIHSSLCSMPNQAIVFQIPQTFVEKFIPEAKYLAFSLKDPADTRIEQTKIDLFKDILVKMQFLIDQKPEGAILRFNSMLFEVLYQLLHNFSKLEDDMIQKKRSKNLLKLTPILDYIETNYNTAISLDEISRVAMFDSKYFCRFFKKNMGMTFLEYQNEIRLSKIYQDIISSDEKISTILDKHGFTNYKLFRIMFQSRFGGTPSKIRKERRFAKELIDISQ